MDGLTQDLIHAAVRAVRRAALDDAAVIWPEGRLAAPFATLLVRGWLPDRPMLVLRFDDGEDQPLFSLCEKLVVHVDPVQRSTLPGLCAKVGCDLLLAAAPPTRFDPGDLRLVSLFEGWPEEALARVPTEIEGGRLQVDEHELVTVAMQRMRRLGYL